MAEHTYSHVVVSTLSQMRKLGPGDMQSSARGYTCGEEGEEPFASALSLCMMSQSPLQELLDHDTVSFLDQLSTSWLQGDPPDKGPGSSRQVSQGKP